MAFAEKNIAKMALVEKAPTKEDDVAEEAFFVRKIHEDTAMHNTPKEAAVAEKDLPKRAFSETQETQNNNPNSGGVDKIALLAVFDVETMIAETALVKAVSKKRSKGNGLETSPSTPSFSWNQVLKTMIIDSILGDNPISLSQCNGFSLS